YARKNPGALPIFRGALEDAVLYMAAHKEQVNSWAADLSGIPASLLDEGSRSNPNYLARSRSEVELGISPRFLEKLDRLGGFLLAEKLIQQPAAVRNHVLVKDQLPK